MPTKDYTYRALRAASIRLLHIRTVRPDGTIEIELQEIWLSDCPQYEALSYTWGQRLLNRNIICEGKRLRVTENCLAALRRLAQRTTRYFWIDSICIDQQSILEKQIQIPYMSRIYGDADRVIVWLGEATGASDRAIQYLKDIFAAERGNIALNVANVTFNDPSSLPATANLLGTSSDHLIASFNRECIQSRPAVEEEDLTRLSSGESTLVWNLEPS